MVDLPVVLRSGRIGGFALDGLLEEMVRIATEKTPGVLVWALVLVLLAGFSIALWAGVSAANADARLSVREAYPLLAAPQSPSDVLPEGFPVAAHGDGGLKPDSSRFAGKFKSIDFYIAEDELGNVCLVSNDVEAQVTASSCAPPDTPADRPLGLSSWNYVTGGFEAYYVPEAFSDSPLPDAWSRSSSQLIVLDSETVTEEIAVLTSRDGASELQLTRFEF
jgi:hypothetical protein